MKHCLPFGMSIVLLLGASACGGSSNGPSRTAASTDRAAAYCATLNSCSNNTALNREFGDMTTCQSRMQQNYLSEFSAPGTSMTTALMQTCADAVSKQTCYDFNNNLVPQGCDIPPGTLAAGSPCIWGSQCQTNLCTRISGQSCGQCESWPVAGASCLNSGSIVAGFKCLSSGTWAALGTTPGATCSATAPCGWGYVCMSSGCELQATTVGAACTRPVSTEPSCNNTYGVYCMSNACVQDTMLAANAPCATSGQAEQCSAGGTCIVPAGTSSGTCIAPATEGSACDTVNGPNCQAPAHCIGTTTNGGVVGTCQLLDPIACGGGAGGPTGTKVFTCAFPSWCYEYTFTDFPSGYDYSQDYTHYCGSTAPTSTLCSTTNAIGTCTTTYFVTANSQVESYTVAQTYYAPMDVNAVETTCTVALGGTWTP